MLECSASADNSSSGTPLRLSIVHIVIRIVLLDVCHNNAPLSYSRASTVPFTTTSHL
jgi:hypothetical protein